MDDVKDGENFAEHPVSLAERRATKEHDARLWTPRDAVIDVLRRMDSGELKADAVIIGIRETDETGTRSHYSVACPDAHVALGLIERVKFKMMREE